MTVLERLRELEGAGCLGTCEKFEACNCAKYAADNLPTLLALAEAVKKMVDNPAWQGMCDQDVAVEKALAELEKEAP